jgi:hypothetical protein
VQCVHIVNIADIERKSKIANRLDHRGAVRTPLTEEEEMVMVASSRHVSPVY